MLLPSRSMTAHVRWLPAIALLLWLAPALAWAPLGHRIVGELAQRELTAHAAATVADLLRGEPDPTLAGVSNWADTLRQDDPARFTQSRSWHYVKLPGVDCNYVLARDCAAGSCVVEAITAQQQVLADPAQPRQARIDALKLLVHLVGDVHQPLHAGHAGDRGGNRYQISLRTTIPPEAYARDTYVSGVQGTNLHAVWDYAILANHDTDAHRYANALAARGSADRNAPTDEITTAGGPSDWAMESCRIIAAESLYPDDHKLDAAYLEKMRPIAERRLIQAGHRLATLLNASLRNPPGK